MNFDYSYKTDPAKAFEFHEKSKVKYVTLVQLLKNAIRKHYLKLREKIVFFLNKFSLNIFFYCRVFVYVISDCQSEIRQEIQTIK